MKVSIELSFLALPNQLNQSILLFHHAYDVKLVSRIPLVEVKVYKMKKSVCGDFLCYRDTKIC